MGFLKGKFRVQICLHIRSHYEKRKFRSEFPERINYCFKTVIRTSGLQAIASESV